MVVHTSFHIVQFVKNDPQRVATRQSWVQHQKKFSRWIKNINQAPIRVTRIPSHVKLYALLYVYWSSILLTMVISLCILLFVRLAIDNHRYGIASLHNQQLFQSYNTLQFEHTECRTQEVTLLHNATVAGLGNAGLGLGSASVGPASSTKISDDTKLFVCGVASNMMNLLRGK